MPGTNWAISVLAALDKLANSPSNTWEQAESYATLPDPTTCADSTWLVLKGTGVWPFTNPAGWYHSNGTSWSYLGAYNPIVTGGNVTVDNFPAVQPVSFSGNVTVGNFPASQAVTGTFWQATQPISGAVTVSNFPATQPVSGSVSVSNFPISQAVTGIFWQATQPISGSVSVSNFPATQPVSGTFWQATQPISGTVSVGNFPASQAVTGTFWPVTQPVSGTFWQATQPISGAVSVSNFPASQAVTGTFWQVTQPISGAVSVSNFPATQPVSGTFWQATQPVSAAALPLPSGASTEATLALIKAKTDNIDVLLSTRTKPADTQTISGTVVVSSLPSVSLGNTTGKTNVLKTGTLVTTAVTADQVVLTYTVTAGKTFYLQYFTLVGRLTVLAATASILGTTSLETPSGTKAYTMTWTNPTISFMEPNTVTFCEPIPIAAGTVIRVVCTPAAVTSMTWLANFGGYEK